jgi:hypothetical protein
VAEFGQLEPFEALSGWLHRLVGYLRTKQALAAELLDYVERDSLLFQSCRSTLFQAGEPLLARAQRAGVIRPDTNVDEVIQLVGGIAKIANIDEGQMEHLVGIAIDGLRYTPAG